MKNGVRHVGVIDNEGPNTLKAFLGDHLPSAASADVGAAFITSTGLNHVLGRLKKVANRGRVRLLTGFFQSVTEPTALRRLLAVETDLGDRFAVRVSSDPHFHWKSYFLLTRSAAVIAVGSSNLTDDGLRSSGEISLTLTLPRTTTSLRRIRGAFEAEWDRGVPLSDALIRRYAKARPEGAGRSTQPRMPFSALLGAVVRETVERPVRSFWRDAIVGEVSEQTADTIADETNWDDKGYGWYSTGYDAFNVGDRIVLFDFVGGHVELVRVLRTTRTVRQTPDGRYFAAYEKVPGSRRRKLGRAIWMTLRRTKCIATRSAAKNGRKLREGQFEGLVDSLELL